jgi:glycosyltransferase involved in cell wall biosynthesis
MTVSVALIVKNEQRTLSRCLDSFHSAVDEIVVVDTGSDDATKDVAGRYTDRVYDFPWGQDFGAARQFALERTSGDWVAWVDADDVVLGAERIRAMLSTASDDTGVFSWPYVVDRDEQGNSRCEYWRERCVRNDGSFHWSGRIHEVLVSQRAWQEVRTAEIVVEHRPELSRGEEKLRRNLNILEAEYAQNPDSPSLRLLFYLGRAYASAGETARALAMLQRYLRVATWDDERYLAQTKVAELYRIEQRYDLAIESDLQALKICPHWPDAYFGLARTYYFLQDWHKVIHWTDLGRAMPRPETIHILNPLDYRYNWIIYYTNALYHVGAIEEAQAWTRRALQICPDDPWHRENFHLFSTTFQHAGQSGNVRGAAYG